MKRFIFSFLLLIAFALPAFSQGAATVRTTLSADLAGGTDNQTLSVTSTTGMTASGSGAQYFVLIDRELMQVTSLSPFRVLRAQGGSNATPHASGQAVYWGMGGTWDPRTGRSTGVFIQGAPPVGSCTRSQQQYLPLMNVNAYEIYNCLGGQWYTQIPENASLGPVRPCTLRGLGQQALSATGIPINPGTAGNFLIGSFYQEDTQFITSLYPLWGITVGSAAGWVVGILDATGNRLFNTTTAGTASGTASTFQGIAVGTSGLLTGPNRYFFFVQNAGTTDGIRVLSLNAETLSGLSAGTFGTLGSLGSASIPTTTTAGATAPVICAGP